MRKYHIEIYVPMRKLWMLFNHSSFITQRDVTKLEAKLRQVNSAILRLEHVRSLVEQILLKR